MTRLVLMLLVASAACAACGDKPVAPFPKSTPLSAKDQALGAGDIMEIRVWGEEDLSGVYEAQNDGSINFPLIGAVQVVGMLPTEVQTEIQARLKDGYLKNPSVIVRVTEYRSKKVTVNGQVRAPGIFPYTEGMTITDAVAKAGGFTAMARKNAVKVTRPGDGKAQTIVVAVEEIGKGRAPNFLLHPGDNVLVEERPF
jgi:polysaccharide export outer membrane protein